MTDTNVITYDEPALVRSLQSLDATCCVVFSASCAQRIVRRARFFTSLHSSFDPNLLERSLAAVWDSPSVRLGDAELMSLINRLSEEVPEEEELPSDAILEGMSAVSACNAVIYTLRAQHAGNAQEAAWAARTVYSDLDNFVITVNNFNMSEANSSVRVLCHPLIQRELFRQRRDVDELRIEPLNREVIDRLHSRSELESESVYV